MESFEKNSAILKAEALDCVQDFFCEKQITFKR